MFTCVKLNSLFDSWNESLLPYTSVKASIKLKPLCPNFIRILKHEIAFTARLSGHVGQYSNCIRKACLLACTSTLESQPIRLYI